MATTSNIHGNVNFTGQVGFTGTMTLAAACVTDSKIAAAADIDHTKLQHRQHVRLAQAAGTDATAETRVIYIAHKACAILAVECVSIVAATGGDKKATVDVKKSAAGAAFASILTAAVDADSSRADRTKFAATLSGTPTLADGDILEIVITVAGSTGSQTQGLCVDVTIQENGA